MTFDIDLSRYPLDVGATVLCGQTFRWQREGPNSWSGIDGCHSYRLTQTDHLLNVETDADEAAFHRLFRFDLDLTELRERLLEGDSRLAPILDRYRGLRLMRQSDPLEVLFSFVCTANNHVPRILGMVRQLALKGTPHPLGGHRFPTLEALASLSEEELLSAGFGYRAKSCTLIARALFAQGGVEGWERESYLDVRKRLLCLPYIGPKLADCIALLAFDKTESVPIDTHLWKAAAGLYLDPTPDRITPRRYEELGDAMRQRFGTLAGFAQHFLFVDRLFREGSLRAKEPLRSR